ncbi:16S rRNA (cytidine(1402)-2'-O)-methyltransferase [Leucobacter sp. OH1287]|uniref:16S rRNA (cytidine(1402)-2'-O)-methyltransferase n=1 Tax=Leucobacter sp. OH1287 TaxID=2491049 RepID=UPI000F5D616D|nr:16S rRNA (cytidine(1402)-2'-O)-methyltransferase [Leucobacter sp. OH1287]RRD61609.1 16S rRNA (cytidine(1402)-2'-O)-methyltransferase [Leucobacter sp. OH1287]
MLVLAATPIGNLQDASPRLLETLKNARVIAAEDTRTTKQLLKLLGVATEAEFVAIHDHNEHTKAAGIAARAAEVDVVLVSDAGMPAVSDPGYRVVAEAVKQGVQVTVIPGPSAVTTALAVSGIPTDRFTFEGFLPRKAGERHSLLAELAAEQRTMVFFESPHRIAQSLSELAEIFGEGRIAAVCRELTKMFEEVKRGTLAELADWTAAGVKGEIVLVVAGAKPESLNTADAVARVRQLTAQGLKLKTAAKQVAEGFGGSARELYNLALKTESTDDDKQ